LTPSRRRAPALIDPHGDLVKHVAARKNAVLLTDLVLR
jgi:hypothetical protein